MGVARWMAGVVLVAAAAIGCEADGPDSGTMTPPSTDAGMDAAPGTSDASADRDADPTDARAPTTDASGTDATLGSDSGMAMDAAEPDAAVEPDAATDPDAAIEPEPDAAVEPCEDVPGAPQLRAASGVATTSFIANWSIVPGATSYVLDVATDVAFNDILEAYDGQDTGAVDARLVTGLTAGTTFYYRIKARNTCGVGAPSDVGTTSTTAPRARSWAAAAEIGMAGLVATAIGISGDAFVAWGAADGTGFVVWARRYVAGTGWEEPTKISLTTGGLSDVHVVVLDDSGAALAVWRQADAGVYSVWANRYLPGTGWSTAEAIADSDPNLQASVDLATDGNGNATVVWLQRGTAGIHGLITRARRCGLPDGWQDPKTIDAVADEPDAPRGDSGRPSVAMMPGHTVAIWHYGVEVDWGAGTSNRTRILAASHAGADNWNDARVLVEEEYYRPGDLPFGHVATPEVAVLASGHASAFWTVRYDPGSTPTGNLQPCLSSSRSDLSTDGLWTQPADSRCHSGVLGLVRVMGAAANDQSVHWLATDKPSTLDSMLVASSTTLWNPGGNGLGTMTSYSGKLAASVNGQVLVAFATTPPADNLRYSWNLEPPQVLEPLSGGLVGVDAAINAYGDAIVVWTVDGRLSAKLFQ